MATGKTYKAFRRKLVTPGALKIAGVPALVDKLNDLGDGSESDAVYAVLMHAALVVRDEVRSTAPYQTRRKHPQGWLHIRDAVFASLGDPSKNPKGPSVIVGVRVRNAPQAFWVEFGTSKIKPEPFWRPGLAAARPAAASIIAEGLKVILQGIATGNPVTGRLAA